MGRKVQLYSDFILMFISLKERVLEREGSCLHLLAHSPDARYWPKPRAHNTVEAFHIDDRNSKLGDHLPPLRVHVSKNTDQK